MFVIPGHPITKGYQDIKKKTMTQMRFKRSLKVSKQKRQKAHLIQLANIRHMKRSFVIYN